MNHDQSISINGLSKIQSEISGADIIINDFEESDI